MTVCLVRSLLLALSLLTVSCPESSQAGKVGSLSPPLTFIRNDGQFDPIVRYHAWHGGMNLFFTNRGFVVQVTALEPPGRATSVHFDFIGSSAGVQVRGSSRRPGYFNYFLGNDPSRWRTHVPTFGALRYGDLYDGIDLELSERGGRLHYDVVAEPGVDLALLRMRCRGADSIHIDADGALILDTPMGPVRQFIPLAWEEDARGRRRFVAARFVAIESDLFGFSVDDRDPTSRLVIDPGLVFSTFLGGTYGDESGLAVCLDSQDRPTVVGYTQSTDFPFDPGSGPLIGTSDAFVTRFDERGQSLVWSTRIGGSGFDSGVTAETDVAGSVYLGGSTGSADFPVTSGAFSTTYGGGNADGFVTRLDSTGSVLVYSTFLGGSDAAGDFVSALTVDSSGAAYAGGFTTSTDFPVTAGAFLTTKPHGAGSYDCFVTRLAPGGGALVFSSFLGGGYIGGIGLIADSSVVVGGETNDPAFPTVSALQATKSGSLDHFVTRFTADGSSLVFSTYLGGSSYDYFAVLQTDDSGYIYFGGETGSADYPVTPNGFDTTFNGATDGTFTKMNPSGSNLTYSSFLGGSGSDGVESLAVDYHGRMHLAGQTDSANFPTTPGCFDPAIAGSQWHDGFVTQVFRLGSKLSYSSFLGGSDLEFVSGSTLDESGALYVTGSTYCPDYRTTKGCFDKFGSASFSNPDCFLTKIRFPWMNLASSLAGASGAPRLSGDGTLAAVSPVRLSLTHALPSSSAFLIVGLSEAGLPFLGGTLVPTPTLVTPAPPISASGKLMLASTWPASAAIPGLQIYMQYWVIDGSGPLGYSASNGVGVVVP